MSTTVDVVKLEQLAFDVNIPVVYFKQALGFPLSAICEATTAVEARNKYNNAFHSSEEATVAYIRWNELSQIEVEAATTITEVQIAYENAAPESAARAAAILKWNELSRKEIEAAVTFAEIQDAYTNAPDEDESEVEVAALEKWIELSSTVDELKVVYFNIPSCGKLENTLLRKMYELYISQPEQG